MDFYNIFVNKDKVNVKFYKSKKFGKFGKQQRFQLYKFEDSNEQLFCLEFIMEPLISSLHFIYNWGLTNNRMYFTLVFLLCECVLC